MKKVNDHIVTIRQRSQHNARRLPLNSMFFRKDRTEKNVFSKLIKKASAVGSQAVKWNYQMGGGGQ